MICLGYKENNTNITFIHIFYHQLNILDIKMVMFEGKYVFYNCHNLFYYFDEFMLHTKYNYKKNLKLSENFLILFNCLTIKHHLPYYIKNHKN